MITRVLIAVGLVIVPMHAFAQTPAQLEFFEKRIRPVLVNHCYECHSKDAKKIRGKLLLDTRADLLKGGVSGPVLMPGHPDKSLLMKAVRHEDKDLRMPKEKLAPMQIADLAAWIAMGAPDPRDGKSSVVRKELDIEASKKFWSFQPVRAATPPPVKDATWPTNAIDRFILARLEANGLTPAPAADARTLIRRVTFDLTGLPPTPEEIEAFVNESKNSPLGSRPSPLEKAVDRLLASPHYGERWGRHWLDVVRYADTAGDNSDYPIPQMYLYRNWVIDAFNRDMPYDQFVREQLAGDLMTRSPHRDRTIATGYLANTRRFGSYEDARYPWHLTIEDTIDNFGKTFLGVSIHCARCHDHKFDPLLADDYYALYGFFSSTRYPWPGIELDRAPRDLVPLGSRDEVEKHTKMRTQKLAELDAAIKKLEASKSEAKLIQAAKKQRELFAKTPLPYPSAYAVIDGQNAKKQRIGQVGNVKVQIKGDPDRLGREVPRRFPLVLGGQTLSPDVKGSGRLELANWVVDPKNPLTARVMVNRIWQYHFGRGIVATPNDFGKHGRAPTHPELLDYLATYFVEHGWSIKQMHRHIILSRVYQQSSQDHEANLKVDPDNEYLWRHARRRLDAESIRDALLAVSGQLDRTPGGPHPFPDQKTWDFTQHKPFKAVYETNRRSVYLMTQRIGRHPFLALFDGSDTNASTASRTVSTTPLQALYLLNDPHVHEHARKFAARLLAEGNDDARIERAFVLAYGRPPSEAELGQTKEHLQRVGVLLRTQGLSADEQRVRAWESVARVVFISSEFVYVN